MSTLPFYAPDTIRISGVDSQNVRANLIAAVRNAIDKYGNDCDLNHLDVRAVTDFRSVFQNQPFRGDISRWDMSNATSTASMFKNCPFNGDISQWDVSRVVHMTSMFAQSEFNGDISRWNTANVLNMSQMFHESDFNGDISAWNVKTVDSFIRTFENSAFTGDLSAWAVSKDTVLCHTLHKETMAKMPASVFHWAMASNGDAEYLSKEQTEHWRTLGPIAEGLGLVDTEAALFLQGQWLEKSAPVMSYALPEMEL